MYQDVIKPRPGLVDPYWKNNPIFRKITVFQPFLEGTGEYAQDLVDGPLNLVQDTIPWTVNEHGPCISMDGSKKAATTKPSDEYNALDITFNFWAATTSTSVDKERLNRTTIDGDHYFHFGRESNDVKCEFKSGGLWRAIQVTVGGHNDGTTHMYTYVSNTTGTYLYFNGLEIGSAGAVLAGTWDSTPWNIGYVNEAWIGTISSVAIWDRALTAFEVFTFHKMGPALGLNDYDDISLFQSPAASDFNVAFALNSNQVL